MTTGDRSRSVYRERCVRSKNPLRLNPSSIDEYNSAVATKVLDWIPIQSDAPIPSGGLVL